MSFHRAGRTAVAGVLAVVVILAWPAVLRAQSVGGRVIDAGTAAPIRGALLRLLDSSGNVLWSTVADDSGRFVLRSATAGSFRLEAQSIGYRTTVAGPVRLEYGSVTEVELRLSSTAVVLDPIRVLAQPRNAWLERVGFYQRKRFHHGIFIDRAEIERRHYFDMASLLRGRPGVRVSTSNETGAIVVRLRAGLSSSVSAGAACEPRVFLNGAEIDSFDFREIRPDDLDGIEIYPGSASLPAQFMGARSGCGVVLLWIRTG